MKHNKKYLYILLVIVSLMLIYFIFQKYKPIKEVHSHVDHALFNNAQELEQRADLIVVGSPVIEFEHNNFHKLDFSKPSWSADIYTVTDIKIHKKIKGKYNNNIIPVAQPAIISNSMRLGATFLHKVLYISGKHFYVMQKDKKYLLFLVKIKGDSKLKNSYCIVSLEQGKFNIDGLDSKEKAMSKRNKQYRNLKQSVINKYKHLFKTDKN